jgi:hypothetical protein
MDGPVAAAHGRAEPRPGRQLADGAEAGDVAYLGQQHQRGVLAHAGQLGEYPYLRVGLRVLADLFIQPADRAGHGVGERQAVVDDLAGDGGQLQGGKPLAARAAPAARGPAVTMVGQDRMDPVAQPGDRPADQSVRSSGPRTGGDWQGNCTKAG